MNTDLSCPPSLPRSLPFILSSSYFPPKGHYFVDKNLFVQLTTHLVFTGFRGFFGRAGYNCCKNRARSFL